jgi:hypothetical protein
MIVADFADFRLCLYVLFDDLWDDLPAWVKPRGEQSKCSNSELLTMLVAEECMGWDEETEAISQWRHLNCLLGKADALQIKALAFN